MNSQRFSWRDQKLHLSLNSVRLSIAIESSNPPSVYNYDLTGRPWNIYKAGKIYQRGLDGKIVSKWSHPESGRGRRRLELDEADHLVQEASQLAAQIFSDIQNSELSLKIDGEGRLLNILDTAGSFAGRRAAEDSERFNEIYTPVGILPPDQYQAVLLQATEGCSFNSCTFCEFYKGRRFHIKSKQAFKQHARAVYEFLGPGLSLRRTIFLGDANALVIPTDQLLSIMEISGEIFDVESLGGFYAFLDGFSGDHKSQEEFERLKHAGLERIYIGLESGHDPLLRFLNKPGDSHDVLSAVKKMKAGGIPVGIIVLLGAGGEKYARGHVEDTVNLINQMHLNMDDQVYFSELIELEGMGYASDAFTQSVLPLDRTQILEQAEMIQKALKFDASHGTPHISRYDIREFVY